jgi:hypothetical protein
MGPISTIFLVAALWHLSFVYCTVLYAYLTMSNARFIGGTVLAAALFLTGIASGGDESINEEAHRHFKAGVNLLQDPDGARYEDAYREFEAAYAASLSPKILGNIGYCALKLERDGESISAYTRYLQEVQDIDPIESAQIARDVATLRAGLVRVVLTVDASGATAIDKRLPVRGESITNLYGPASGRIEIGLRPGHHVIVLKTAGETIDSWEFDARPGATLSRTFTRKQAAEPPRRSSSLWLPWVVTSVGGAALATGGILGVITLGKVTTIGNHCPSNQCPSAYSLEPAQEDARRFIRLTDTFLIGGGVVAATGLGLVLFSGAPEAPRQSGARAIIARSGLDCSPSGCVGTMSGQF